MAVADAELELLDGLGLGVRVRTRVGVRGRGVHGVAAGRVRVYARRLQGGLQAARLEERLVLQNVERVEDVKVQPLGEDERVVEQVRQLGLAGEEVVAVGGAQ
tara:strand:+ start:118 stop:426 length:309 start_codon:yes stop_codon:yes gene_type:complete